MSVEDLKALADELSVTARSYDGVIRETVIKEHGRKNKKSGTELKSGVSIQIFQFADGIKSEVGDTFKSDGLVTAEAGLREGHMRLDKTLVGGLRGNGTVTPAPATA